MLPVLIFAFLCVTPVFSKNADHWTAWKQKHRKTYVTDDLEAHHRAIWEDHYNTVQTHNSNTDKLFIMEMNLFADQNISRPQLPKFGLEQAEPFDDSQLKFTPSSWDWRTKGVINPVRNQGQMGYAVPIVLTECIESYSMIHSGLCDGTLSVSEVVDCCHTGGSAGGKYDPMALFKCVVDIGGLCFESTYPATTGSCKNTSCTAIGKINGGKLVPKGDETQMMASVFTTPVMTGIDASRASFQLYRSGIYSDPKCSTTKLDHVIQVVGYGSTDGQDYWICRNTWGTNWGMNGYILIARNKGNMCGIATEAAYPV